MNNEIINKAKELRKEIDNLQAVKDYYRYREIYQNSEELADIRQNIARLASEKKFEERDNLLKIYNNHPLVVNYENSKKEVIEILNVIKDILQ